VEIKDIHTSTQPCVATIGFFDGVHRGHRYLVEQLQSVAAERDLATAVITFRKHPRKVLHQDFQPQLLTTTDEKLQLLEDLEIDLCILLDFTEQLATFSAFDFMKLLYEECHVKALIIGYDHRFGHNRTDGFDDYVRYGQQLGMDVIKAQPLIVDGQAYSSSLVRRLIQHGDVDRVPPVLGYRYFITGVVVAGHKIGREMGFPTANIQVDDPDKIIPADGVYAAMVRVGSKEWGGMLSIGTRPTINNGTDRSIEAHLFDFDGDIYGEPIRITFVCRTRGEISFPDRDSLVAQLRADDQQIRKILGY